jgi:hypothetical protein
MTETDRVSLSRRVLAKSFAKPTRTVDAESLALGLLGALDDEGKELLSDEELGQPLSLIMFNQVLRPALKELLPDSWSTSMEAISETEESGKPGLPTAPVSVVRLEEDMKSLKNKLEQQKKLIDGLNKKLRDMRGPNR